jgi:haloalkane dehalogenase
LGFGLSQKPETIDYRPEKQADRLEKLVLHLNLRDITLVVHDMGGPIGLNFAINYPGRVREIIVFNSWMWPLQENPSAMRLATLVGHPLNRLYYRILNATPGFIMPALFADRHRIPKSTQMQYLEPFRGFTEREGLYQMIQGLKRSNNWFQVLWDRRDAIEHKRFLFLWGMRDPMYTEAYLDRWRSTFRHSETVKFPNVGRFVPEEAPKSAADEIRWFLLRSPTLTPIAEDLT